MTTSQFLVGFENSSAEGVGISFWFITFDQVSETQCRRSIRSADQLLELFWNKRSSYRSGFPTPEKTKASPVSTDEGVGVGPKYSSDLREASVNGSVNALRRQVFYDGA